MAKEGAGEDRRGAQFRAHGVPFSASGTAQDRVPPMRKNAPALLTERTFQRGGTDFIRRDYGDGTVDLIYFDGERGAWVYEIYRRYPLSGMDYDFEECLASPVSYMRYLVAIGVRCVVFGRKTVRI